MKISIVTINQVIFLYVSILNNPKLEMVLNIGKINKNRTLNGKFI